MADDEGTEYVSRGNEWEVVSLTASTYAAAPGPDENDLTSEENSRSFNKAETSDAMYMSRHFVFPPSQHENLPLELENFEAGGAAGPEFVEEFGGKSDTKDDEHLNIEELTVAELYSGIPIIDEKGNLLSVSGSEYQAFPSNKEQNFYGATNISSFQSESATVEENRVITESIEFFDQDPDSVVSNTMHAKKDDYDEPNLPCEAWWKKHAASIYAHAKEANSFWSVFVAAAVMGLVILGQRWQQERWQVLQLKWQFGVNDEKMSRFLGPLSRLKDVIVGGNRQGTLIRESSSMER